MPRGLQNKLQEMSGRTPPWLLASDRDRDGIFISTRARLARNIRGRPFSCQMDEEEAAGIFDMVCDACSTTEPLAGMDRIPLEELTWEDRRLLQERFLISPVLVEANGSRGLLVSPDEGLTLTVNEEDHLRIHVVHGGLGMEGAWRTLDLLDDELGTGLAYAYREPFGFLTASPTNAGTGFRISLLLHLPALVLSGEVESVLRKVTGVGMLVRGVYGEGSAVFGNLFQLSNQMTLGRSEEDILASVAGAGRQVARYEIDARENLLHEARVQLEDKIHRALGLLRSARVLSLRECMNLLSAVRLGVNMEVLSGVDISRLDVLTILTQPSHLDRRAGRVQDPSERDVLRADLVRTHMA